MLKELIAQKNELDTKIAEAKKVERVTAIKTVKDLMAEFEITDKDLNKATRAKVAPKYQDPVSGKQWTGRGKKPLFIREAEANGTLENCRIV